MRTLHRQPRGINNLTMHTEYQHSKAFNMDGIFVDHFIANLLTSVPTKTEKCSAFDKVISFTF